MHFGKNSARFRRLPTFYKPVVSFVDYLNFMCGWHFIVIPQKLNAWSAINSRESIVKISNDKTFPHTSWINLAFKKIYLCRYTVYFSTCKTNRSISQVHSYHCKPSCWKAVPRCVWKTNKSLNCSSSCFNWKCELSYFMFLYLGLMTFCKTWNWQKN